MNAQNLKLYIKAITDFSDVQSNVKNVQQVLERLKLPDNLKKNFTGLFTSFEKEAEKYQKFLNSGFKTKKDVTGLEQAGKNITQILTKIQSQMGSISTSHLKEVFKIDTTALTEAQNKVAEIQKQMSMTTATNLSKEISNVSSTINKLQTFSKNKELINFEKLFKAGDIEGARQSLERLHTASKKFQEGSKNKDNWDNGVKALRASLQALTADSSLIDLNQRLNQAKINLDNIESVEFTKFVNGFQQGTNALGQMIEKTKVFNNEQIKTAQNTHKLTSELETLKYQTTYFFGLTNSINLFKRALREAYQTVKELDAAMTATAVVTDFTVSDMWGQLPEYTKRANELGVAVKGAYEAATLYYQQGLKTDQVVAVSNETLKMARIAGMDYAEATDSMTAALRGFNMEVNEISAQKVNDVYSKLAAITASDTQEISTAMSKTASIAASANMEFETTAAFLSQIIETTREAPETAGTALKTVIARFQELKKQPSEIGEVEGEIVDANKIETALRTIEVALRDTNGQFRALDEVFLDIAAKWDDLDTNTQRYIATMAAGSRQQSRFIAMMSDYDRTMELVSAANDSAGASQAQFEKTLDSLESKLAKLDNAWNEFTMGIANNVAVKTGVDLLTLLLNTINNVTGILPDGVDSIAKLGITLLGLRTGLKIFDTFWLNLENKMGPAAAMTNATKTAFAGLGKVFTADFWTGQGAASALTAYTKATTGASVATGVEAKALQNLSLYLGLTAEQTRQFNALTSYGVDASVAAAMASENYSVAKIRESLAREKNRVATEGEVAAEIKEIAATYQEKNAEKIANYEKKKGVLTRIANKTAAIGETIAQKLHIKALLQEAKTEKALLVLKAKRIALTLGTAAAVAVLIFGIKKLYDIIKDNTPEAKLKKIKENTEKAGEAAQEASDKYNELKESLDSLGEKYDTIEDLTVGTQAWKDAVQETNNQVLSLIEKYKELAKYVTIGENGELVLNLDSKEVQDIITSYSNKAQEANIIETASKVAVEKQKQQTAIDELNQNYKVKGEKIVNGVSVPVYYTDDEIIKVAKEYATGRKGINEDSARATALRDLGKEIIASENTISAEYKLITSNAIQNLEKTLTNEEVQGINGLIDNKIIDSLIEREKENLEFNKVEAMKTYADTLGYSEKEGFSISGNIIKYLDENGEKQSITVTDEELKLSEASIVATEKLTEAILQMPTILKDDSLRKFYLNSEGKGLNKTDLENIEKNGSANKYAKMEWEKLPSEIQLIYGEGEEGLKTFSSFIEESIKFANDYYTKSEEAIANLNIDFKILELNKNLSSGAVEGLTSQFTSIFERVGKQGTEEIFELFSPIFKNLNDEEANNFAIALNSINWSSSSSISGLSDQLKGMGIDADLTDNQIFELEQQLIDLAEATDQIDLDNLLSQTKELREVADDIKDRENTEGITQEEYDLIAGTNKFDMSKFGWTGQEWIYLEGTMDELAKKLEKISGELATKGLNNENITNPKLRQETLLAKQDASGIYSTSGFTEEEKNKAIKTIIMNKEIASTISLIKKRSTEAQKAVKNYENTVIDLAVAVNQAEDKFGNLNTKLQENYEALKTPEVDSEAYFKAIGQIAAEATAAFGREVDSEFVISHLDTFISIIEGEGGEKTKKAYRKLSQEIYNETLRSIGKLKDGTQVTIDSIVSYIESQNPNLEFGGTFDASQIFNKFAETQEAAAKLQEVLTSLGYITSNNLWFEYEKDGITGYAYSKEGIEYLTGNGYTYKGVAAVSGLGTYTPPEDFKPPKAGGSTSKSTSEWENPYDEQYNTLEKINEALRDREELEKDYQLLQKKGVVNGKDALNYYNAIFANLKKQVDLQKTLIAGRQKELTNLLAENPSMTQYAKYDESSGLIEIQYDLIDAIKKSDEKTGEAVEKFISELERISESIEDAQDELIEIENNQEDIKDQLVDTYLAFEDRVAAALEAIDQKQVDLLQEEFDALTEAEESLADAISKSIDEMRQARENEKTEEEIAEKERRLAYLRQDTTGSNALEIKRLEEEIAEQREGYQDALIDQALTNMQEQNELAAEQRDKQIELMQSQIEYNVETGVYAKQVAGLIESAMEGDHMLTKDDELYDILNDGENWRSLSEQGFKAMFEELASQISDAYAAMNNAFGGNGSGSGGSSSARLGFMGDMMDLVEANGGLSEDIRDEIERLNALRNEKIDDPNYTGSQEKLTNSQIWALLREWWETQDDSLGDTSKKGTSNTSNSSSSSINKQDTNGKNYTTYRVKEDGETLGYIAKKYGTTAQKIASLNGWSTTVELRKGEEVKIPQYKTGGLADFTGPAWLDGSKGKPELVLNARDTENFIVLKDVLSGLLHNTPTNNSNGGDNYFDITIQVEEISNDYDVDQMAARIKQNIYEDSMYRNVNAVNFLR